MSFPETLQLDNFPNVDELTLAYLAGVVDSDGYISIHRSTRKGKVYFAPVMGVSGTRPAPHNLASSIWGGKVNKYFPKNKLHRPQYQWQRMGELACIALVQISPYLRIKKEQAELAFQLYDHLEFGRADDPFPWFSPNYNLIVRRIEMWEEMIDLNQSRNRIRQFGKKNAGRLLDCEVWSEFPKE